MSSSANDAEARIIEGLTRCSEVLIESLNLGVSALPRSSRRSLRRQLREQLRAMFTDVCDRSERLALIRCEQARPALIESFVEALLAAFSSPRVLRALLDIESDNTDLEPPSALDASDRPPPQPDSDEPDAA